VAPFADHGAPEPLGPWILCVAGAGLLLAVLAANTGLFDLDEGFYAAVAGEMARTGDLLTPRYMGAPFMEKPPLLYWAMVLFLKLGMPPVFAVRMPSVIAAIATMAMVGKVAARRGGGWLSVTALALSPLFIGLGHLALTDMMLTCFLTGAFLLFWSSISGGPQWLRVPAAVCLALATLTKGPVAGVLFVLVAGITYLLQPALRPSYRRYWPEAILAYVLIVLPWYYFMYRAHGGEFFQEFVLRQNIARFGGGDTAHVFPFYFYIPVLLVGFFPWSIYLPWLAFKTRRDPWLRYCWTWAWVVFLLFTLSGAKLPGYILPMLPPLAAVLPLILSQMWESAAPVRTWAASLRVSMVATAIVVVALVVLARTHATQSVASALPPCAVLLLCAMVLATLLYRLLRPEVGHVAAPLILGAGLALPMAFLTLPAYYADTQADIHALTEDVRPLVDAGAPYCMYGVRPGRPSVVFLLGGGEQSAQSDADLVRLVAAQRKLVVITHQENARGLARLPWTVVARRGRFAALQYPRDLPPPVINGNQRPTSGGG
jgi:4-amino-4-deoxy-L-arabinose transferase-like glycosyltransferase